MLESTFQKTHYPEIRMVDDLSSMLNLSTERISIWFQNRRARFKKTRKLEVCQENATSTYTPVVTPPIPPNTTSHSSSSSNHKQTTLNNSSYTNLSHHNPAQGYMPSSMKLDTSNHHEYSLITPISTTSLSHTSTSFPFTSQHLNQITSNNGNSHIPFPYSNHSR